MSRMRHVGEIIDHYTNLGIKQDEDRERAIRRTDLSISQSVRIDDATSGAMTKALGKDTSSIEFSSGNWRTNLEAAQKHAYRRRTDANQRAETEEYKQFSMEKALGLCDSPIERGLLPWLCYADYGNMFDFPVPVLFNRTSSGPFPRGNIFIVPQFNLMKYRADFAIIARLKGQTKIAIVECDGNAFHQSAPDRVLRDGMFASFGIRTHRITGSDCKFHPDKLVKVVANDFYEWALELGA